MRPEFGWAGTVEAFLFTRREDWLADLTSHHRRLMGANPSGLQIAAWRSEFETMAYALGQVTTDRGEAREWGVVFEYELPLEGGRRPDVVVLAGGGIVVLEFKNGPTATRGAADQVRAYARDLAEYHEETRGRRVTPVLVVPGESSTLGEVRTEERGSLADRIANASMPGTIDLKQWLRSPYRPLPSLVDAARRIFEHEPLPHVKRAESAGIPETVDLINRIITDAQKRGGRHLVFVTGVPGSGKTLVGLRVVYEQAGDEAFGESPK